MGRSFYRGPVRPATDAHSGVTVHRMPDGARDEVARACGTADSTGDARSCRRELFQFHELCVEVEEYDSPAAEARYASRTGTSLSPLTTPYVADRPIRESRAHRFYRWAAA
ncbi:TcmI family type II polyketide cyclase [Streptomyces pimonensis]